METVDEVTEVKSTERLDALATLEKLVPITSTTEDKDKPLSLIKAKAKKISKEIKDAVIEKAFTEARDLINPMLEKMSLGYKASLEDVIKVGEILNDLEDRFKKAKFKTWLPKVGFKLSEQTARNYRSIATHKYKVMENRDEFEKEAKAEGLTWNYSITDALKMVTQAKKLAAAEKARASGKQPKLPRIKKTPDVIKMTKVEGHAVLVLSGDLSQVQAFLDLHNDEMDALNPKFIEGSSLVE